ncbi:hypothetical protein FB45DRAFT_906604 [Roridomyces roridus]|uniref:Uncharacterized protein n=1 Tax=Roridomyces roridus TaxID=1738132 RepID=A0AAD7FTA8_9AGAR|nr:hypothetical protein FB45DRAFT_906604 [Roridomyces roridus]
MTSVSGLPKLPPELEREIFDIAATAAPNMVPALLRVAHRVLEWIEPHLYRHMRISFHNPAYLLALGHALDRKPLDFFAHTARYLSVSTAGSYGSCDLAVVERLLGACTGINDIFFNLSSYYVNRLPPILSVLTHLRPTHLSILGRPPVSGAFHFRLPFFQSLTHLQLLDHGPNSALSRTWPHWPALAKLPFLTHLAVHCEEDVLAHILSVIPNLQVLVLSAFSPSQLRVSLIPRDPRVFVSPSLACVLRWYAAARGGEDLWASADAFIEKKRMGEIEESCCW